MPLSTMTGKERVLAAMRRQPVDYVPCVPMVNALAATQRRGRPWNFPWPEPGDGVEYLATQLGTDPVVPVWWMGGMCPAPGVEEKVWRDGELLHKTISTPSGELHASIGLNEDWPFGDDIPFFHDFVGHYREHWLKTERDVECLRHLYRPPTTADELSAHRAGIEQGRGFAARLGLATMATVGSGLTGALWMFGAEQLCLLAIDNPALVHAYLEVEHQWNLAVLDRVLGWGVDIIRRNGFYESADFYGPAMLEDFLGRRLRAEIAAIHQAGAPVAYTLYSGVAPILDYLAGFDFDCISALDIAFDDLDLGLVQQKCGAKMSFWTGPSNTFHMYEGPAVVRKAVRDVFQAFGRTGLLITACSSVHPMMPWENTLAMIDEWKKLR
jgi:uroporphyrinogen-III decarboxylase